MTQVARTIESNDALTIPRASLREGRHSLTILHPPPPPAKDIETMLAAAEARGLTKIAEALREMALERDLAALERASLAVADDDLLGQALVQFGVAPGVLRCRAIVDAAQEERLIELLGTIEGPRRVDLVVLERPRPGVNPA